MSGGVVESGLGFFDTSAADRLMDVRNFPPGICEFLRQERLLLDEAAGHFDVLVEVGCHDGRYLSWAAQNGKAYGGIDLAARHVSAGRRQATELGLSSDRYRFVLGDARDLSALFDGPLHSLRGERTLVLFPFGLFGALDCSDTVAESLARLRQPFLISLYQTNVATTAGRREYYARCGLQTVATTDHRGVRVTSSRGFESVAYHPGYLLERFPRTGLAAASLSWSTMNLAILPPALAMAVSPRLRGGGLAVLEGAPT